MVVYFWKCAYNVEERNGGLGKLRPIYHYCGVFLYMDFLLFVARFFYRRSCLTDDLVNISLNLTFFASLFELIDWNLDLSIIVVA